MEQSSPKRWMRDLLTVLGFGVIHLAANLFGGSCVGLFKWDVPPSLVGKVWSWIFMFPIQVWSLFGVYLPYYEFAILVPNSILYGVMWWFVGRMCKLLRQSSQSE